MAISIAPSPAHAIVGGIVEVGETVPDSPGAPTGKGKGAWIVLIAGLLLIVAGLFLVRFELTTVAVGEVSRENERYLYSPFDSVVVHLEAREGDLVEKDTPILELDVWDLRREHLEKLRELAEAEAALRRNRIQREAFEKFPEHLDRLLAAKREELLESILAVHSDIKNRYAQLDGDQPLPSLEQSKAHVDLLQTELQMLEAGTLRGQQEAGWEAHRLRAMEEETRQIETRIERLQSQVELLGARLEESRITSPMEGRLTWLGKRRVGLPVRRGELLAKVSDPESPYEVDAWVGERNIDLIRPGTRVRMESRVFDSVFEGYIHGEVKRISAEPHDSPGGDSADSEPRYEVEIAVEAPPYPLMLGSRLETTFILGKQNLFHLILNKAANHRTNPE